MKNEWSEMRLFSAWSNLFELLWIWDIRLHDICIYIYRASPCANLAGLGFGGLADHLRKEATLFCSSLALAPTILSTCTLFFINKKVGMAFTAILFLTPLTSSKSTNRNRMCGYFNPRFSKIPTMNFEGAHQSAVKCTTTYKPQNIYI